MSHITEIEAAVVKARRTHIKVFARSGNNSIPIQRKPAAKELKAKAIALIIISYFERMAKPIPTKTAQIPAWGSCPMVAMR
jgi:hypothetical protein